MEIKHYSFSIADVNLKFEYTETYELDDDTPYIKFRYDGDNFDVINYISIYDHVNKPTFDGTEQIIQFCPSWTIYRYNDKKVVEFHSNDSYIGYIETKDEWSMCHTKVLNGYSQTQLLPISMTGFLCQQIILKRGNTGFFMHGATVMVKGKNIILTGNSGVGKSTLSRLLKKYENGVRITDDRFILLEDDETFYSCGNPFDMKNDECDNVKVKIDAVYFLHHSKINFVKIVPKEKRLMKIFPTAMLPYYAANKLSSSVGVIRRMSNRIDMYDLYFTPDEEGVKCLLNNEGGHQ